MTIELFDLAGADERIRFSPYCWRIRMALAHKGLDVTIIPVRFMDKEKIEFSGQKLVPVIRDGGRTVSDSWAIARYLDDTYPDRPKLFDGPESLALTTFIRNWSQSRLMLPLLRMILMDLFETIDAADRDYFRTTREARFGGKTLEDMVLPEADARATLRSELTPARDTLAAQPFLNGDKPAFADYCLFGAFMWARCVSAKQILEKDDAVYAWRERMLDLYDGLARKAPGRGA